MDKPRWLRDFHRFLPLKSQFVLSGNVRDHQLSSAGASVAAQPLVQHLASELHETGYEHVVVYDPVGGFRVAGLTGGSTVEGQELLRRIGLTPANGAAPAGIDLFAVTLERIITLADAPVALIADFASRLVVRNDALSQTEHHAFTRALIASHQARARPYGHSSSPVLQYPHLGR
jgi:hypothetical protein